MNDLKPKFNMQDKVTTKGGDYQSPNKSVINGNFSDKDASIKRLTKIGKEDHCIGRAYDCDPIKEVFKSATSK